MGSTPYTVRRAELETYFDRTAVDAWAKLTSTAKVSGIRATVRAGRDAMRATLLGYLPADLSGARLLDAGCGTGMLAVEAARRGAHVVAVDISPTLVGLANDRLPHDLLDPKPGAGRIGFHVGDMLDPTFGAFDYVVAMDSLIHYRRADVVAAVGTLGRRTGKAILFTFAPRTPLLTAMHTVGLMFPRSDRAPAIEPHAPDGLRRALTESTGWMPGRNHRVSAGFYKSEAQEMVRR